MFGIQTLETWVPHYHSFLNTFFLRLRGLGRENLPPFQPYGRNSSGREERGKIFSIFI